MAITISGTNGIVGAGFTVDNSGVSVTAGVGTFGTLAAPAAGLTGALPAISAASLTQIPAANIVGVCTSGLTKTGGFGSILQVLQTVKTDTASVSSNSYGDLSGMSQAITTTGSNKVLVRLFIQWGTEAGHAISFRLARTTSGSTTNTLIIGDDGNSRDRVTLGGLASNAPWEVNPGSMEFLDSPSAGTHTYKLQWAVPSGATTAYFNRSFRDNDAGGEARTPSVITVMEVAA